MTDADKIARLIEVEKKATPGPWTHEPTASNLLDRILYSNQIGSMHYFNLMTLADGDWNHVSNVDFIVAAREGVPAMAVRIARLEAALKPFAEEIERADNAAISAGFAASFDEYKCAWQFTFGTLRRAKAALEDKP